MAENGGGKSFPLSVVITAVDKITGPLKKITTTISGAGKSISGFGSSLTRLSDRSGLPVLANAFGRVGSAAGAVLKRVAFLGAGIATMAAAGVAALIPFAKSFADATGAIGDAAERTGASRERIQELGYAAQLTGSSAESMNNALQKMNLAIGNAKGGSKELKQMFQGLNISFKNANGTAKTTDEMFDLIANRISRIKDPALQAKAAVAIFGKSATELLPLLRSGTKGIAEMSAEARRLGLVIPESGVAVGEEFGDTLDKLSFALKGVGNTIGVAVTPALNKLANQLIETIVKYRPQIEAFANAFADNLPKYIDDAGAALGKVWAILEPLGKAITVVADNIGVFQLALDIGVGVAIAAVIGPVYTLTTAFVGLAAAFLATPFGLVAAGIAGLAAGAVLIYKNWGDIKKFFLDMFGSIGRAFGKLVELIGGAQVGQEINAQLSQVKVPGGQFMGGRGPVPNPNYTAVPEGGAIAAGLANAKANITVDFKNLPPGASVDTATSPGAQIKTNQGYSMMRIDQ